MTNAHLLDTRKGRIFFIHVPIFMSLMIGTFLFAGAAKNWSDTATVVVGAVVVVLYTAFVLVPLLVLVTPAKDRKERS